ncbi:hypothetical protein E2C01_008260 [Portunus trituberculatus]|uniref:Secreted protein n=1 Tax=Portunus trituberculatus TaxID=210409 RepID=A0A5B7D1V9_PORTR|nr:hypothetical protein [Portunus trituberculatus]
MARTLITSAVVFTVVQALSVTQFGVKRIIKPRLDTKLTIELPAVCGSACRILRSIAAVGSVGPSGTLPGTLGCNP